MTSAVESIFYQNTTRWCHLHRNLVIDIYCNVYAVASTIVTGHGPAKYLPFEFKFEFDFLFILGSPIAQGLLLVYSVTERKDISTKQQNRQEGHAVKISVRSNYWKMKERAEVEKACNGLCCLVRGGREIPIFKFAPLKLIKRNFGIKAIVLLSSEFAAVDADIARKNS